MPINIAGVTQDCAFELQPGFVAYDLPDITLKIVEVQGASAPTTLLIELLNGPEEGNVTFTIGATTVAVIETDLEGQIAMASISVPSSLAAGTYTLTAAAAGLTSGTATFTLTENPTTLPPTPAAPIPPTLDPDEYSWVLHDPVVGGLGRWVMPISPSRRTPFKVRKQLTAGHTTNYAGGQFHVCEGHTPPTEIQFGGYCPDQDFYDNLNAYVDLMRRIYLTDHRQRTWVVLLLHADMEPRLRQRHDDGTDNDWAHDYTVRGILLDEYQPPPTP